MRFDLIDLALLLWAIAEIVYVARVQHHRSLAGRTEWRRRYENL